MNFYFIREIDLELRAQNTTFIERRKINLKQKIAKLILNLGGEIYIFHWGFKIDLELREAQTKKDYLRGANWILRLWGAL